MSIIKYIKELFKKEKPIERKLVYRDFDGRFVKIPKAMRQVLLLNHELWLDIELSAAMSGVTINELVNGKAKNAVGHLKHFLRTERGLTKKQLHGMFGGYK